MPENITQITRREFIQLCPADRILEVGDIIRETNNSRGELVIETECMATNGELSTLKARYENGKAVPIKTFYFPVRELGKHGILDHLGLNVNIEGLYMKACESQWNIDVMDYFKDYHTIDKSKLKEVGF